jgi:hypothetical protein
VATVEAAYSHVLRPKHEVAALAQGLLGPTGTTIPIPSASRRRGARSHTQPAPRGGTGGSGRS